MSKNAIPVNVGKVKRLMNQNQIRNLIDSRNLTYWLLAQGLHVIWFRFVNNFLRYLAIQRDQSMWAEWEREAVSGGYRRRCERKLRSLPLRSHALNCHIGPTDGCGWSQRSYAPQLQWPLSVSVDTNDCVLTAFRMWISLQNVTTLSVVQPAVIYVCCIIRQYRQVLYQGIYFKEFLELHNPSLFSLPLPSCPLSSLSIPSLPFPSPPLPPLRSTPR